MNKKIVLGICCLIAAAAYADVGDTLYVNAKEVSVRGGTGFFSGTLGEVYYGDRVTITAEKDKWVQIMPESNPSLKGWVSSDVLTKKKIIVRNGQNAVNASADELALAGKGFSAEIENSFKGSKGGLRYDLVDQIEQNKVPEQELYTFIVDGELSGGEE